MLWLYFASSKRLNGVTEWHVPEKHKMLLIYALFEECHHVVELLLNSTNLKMEEKDLYEAKQFNIWHLDYILGI